MRARRAASRDRAACEGSRAAERTFLLSVGHELKTPLTAIRGYSEAIDEGVLTPERAMKVIRTEATRLERLIADLINLARLDQRRFDIHLDTVDLVEIAHESASRHAARARDLGVDIELQNGRPALATADPDRLLQAVSNLVENALRCTPPGGTVTVAASPGELAVKDTGPGIAANELPRAFDRFFLYRRYDGNRPVGTRLAVFASANGLAGGELVARDDLILAALFLGKNKIILNCKRRPTRSNRFAPNRYGRFLRPVGVDTHSTNNSISPCSTKAGPA